MLAAVQVAPCVDSLMTLMRKAPTASLTAVFKKYNAPKFGEVAKLQPPSEDEHGDVHRS